MLERDVGYYDAVASNEHGEARQRVRLEIAEYPRFLKRPNETYIMANRNGRLEARVIGVPGNLLLLLQSPPSPFNLQISFRSRNPLVQGLATDHRQCSHQNQSVRSGYLRSIHQRCHIKGLRIVFV